MKSKKHIYMAATLLILLASSTLASADIPVSSKDTSREHPFSSPSDSEFFQLTFPVSTKPRWTSNVIYTSMVDHTPPFYNGTDEKLIPYTGEVVTPTIQYDPTLCANTANGREYCYNGHSGLDIPVGSGTPVYASHAGIVKVAGQYNCYGTAVILEDVDNPQFFTLYGHLTDTRLNPEDQVARGQLIGYSGNTACSGGSTGPHLHFGLYYSNHVDTEGNVLDPYGWFSQNPNPIGAPVTDYKWASGYAPDGNSNEPENWNQGAIIGNEYITKERTHHGANMVGAIPSPTVEPPVVDPIEHWWANNYGSAGAPYNPVTNGCQEFEGGTYCRNGTYYYTFEDVPISFWAHRYVGWSHVEDIIDGYPCGFHQNDPCIPPDNRPYFEPTAFVTRGQFSKMVYIGVSLDADLTGAPHFCDVQPGSTFYTYIETLYNKNIIDGYPGGPSCGYSTTYFRPGDHVKRGQASKMVEQAAEQQGWLSGYGDGGGPDFWDVQPGDTFYTNIEELYNVGAVQYRVEEPGRAGQGGHYYVAYDATRAELAMYLHELVYAVSPP